jgi:hypothetical protein
VIANFLRPGLRRQLERQAAAQRGEERCDCGRLPARRTTAQGGRSLAPGQVHYSCATQACTYLLPLVTDDGRPKIGAGHELARRR